MAKVLILGAGGMLGHKLCERMSKAGWETVATARQPAQAYASYPDVFGKTRLIGGVDVMDFAGLRKVIESEGPQAVVNCVGHIKQLASANDRYLAVGLNSYLPHTLARVCNELGARLVHFSTDCVFSGRAGNYHEDAPSDANDVYGKAKYLGEFGEGEGAAVTLRSSIIGRELHDAHGLCEWFLNQRGKTIKGYAGAIYTGFTTNEMARIVDLVLKQPEPLQGTYQVASQPISKFDLLNLIRETAGLDIKIERDNIFQCDRSLVMNRFGQKTGYVAPSWSQMVSDLIDDDVPYDRYRSV